MKRRMTRWTLAGCMALSALGAVAVLDVGSTTADAAPSVSPFAGTYVGADPRGWHSSWPVTISDGGLIASSFSQGRGRGPHGSISGKISADGSYSFDLRYSSGSEGAYQFYKSTGKMALDAAGDIVGKEKNGNSFVWLRQ